MAKTTRRLFALVLRIIKITFIVIVGLVLSLPWCIRNGIAFTSTLIMPIVRRFEYVYYPTGLTDDGRLYIIIDGSTYVKPADYERVDYASHNIDYNYDIDLGMAEYGREYYCYFIDGDDEHRFLAAQPVTHWYSWESYAETILLRKDCTVEEYIQFTDGLERHTINNSTYYDQTLDPLEGELPYVGE